MKSILKLFSPLFFLLVLYSCEYENSGIYEPKLNQDIGPPEIQTVQLDLNEDTLVIYDSRRIAFVFQGNNTQKVLAVEFYLDNSSLGTIYSDNGSFYIDYNQLAEGAHKIKIELYVNSGSGSIADKLGREGFVLTSNKEWIIKIDKFANNYYTNTIQTSISDGFLKLSWPKVNYNEFLRYQIYRANDLICTTTAEECIDSSYLGENVNYSVIIQTKNGKLFNWALVTKYQDLPRLSFIATETNKYSISWKNKFYKALDKVILLERYNNYTNFVKVKETNDPLDTSYTINDAIFGDQVSFNLKLVPKKNLYYTSSHYFYFENNIVDAKFGFSFTKNQNTIYNISIVNNTEFIYVSGCDSIIKYSVLNKRVTQQIGYQNQTANCSGCSFAFISTSPSGKYISAYTGCDQYVLLINSNNLSHTAHDLKYLSGSPVAIVSDVATGIINTNNNGFYIYDFNSSSTLANYENANSGHGLKTSPNGDYFLVQDDSLRLLQFKDLQFKTIWKKNIYYNYKLFEFDPLNPNRLFYWDGSTFMVKQCNDFSTIYEFSLTDDCLQNIDYYNNELLTYRNGHLYIRSLQNGTLLKDIPYNLDASYWYNKCYLINHSIVSITGVIYFAN